MPTQLTKLALVNTSDLTETLVFSVFQEGAEEASRQVLSIEPNTAIIENEREIHPSKNYNITVSGMYSDAAATQLNTWKNDSTELIFTGYGLDGSILQMEGTVQSKKGLEDNMSFGFSSMREAKGGYSSEDGKHTSGISYCQNGLALYKWGDADSDGLANGWAKSGGTTTFSGGDQTFSTTAASGHSMTRRIYFPFTGRTAYFNINPTTVTATTGVSISIEAFNASDVSQGSDTTNVTSTVDQQASLTIPDDTSYIEVSVNIGENDDITFSDPSLQLKSEYIFTEFYT